MEFEVQYYLDSYDDLDDSEVVPVTVDDPDFDPEERENIPPEDINISFDKKVEVVQSWRAPLASIPYIKSKREKKKRSLASVQSRYRFVKDMRQLYRWEEAVFNGGTRSEKLRKICEHTYNMFLQAKSKKLRMSDMNLRLWAIRASREHGLLGFKASRKWVYEFKKRHRIVNRKITKVVSRRQIVDLDEIKESALDFVLEVSEIIPLFGNANTYNTDQVGYELELHSGRTLDIKGVKTVEALAQSVNATTHSYTAQPTVSADGELVSPLLLVLKETDGKFGPIVEKNLFKPDNIYLMASKSGKMSRKLVNEWEQNVLVPAVGENSLLLRDSWTGFGHPDELAQSMPAGKSITVMVIPKNTTGMIQPLDVYGNRIWKNYVKHFADSVTLNEYDFVLHQRNNIIKMQSLVFDQLRSPRYRDLWRYSWHKCGYVVDRPPKFVNPVTFAFQNMEDLDCYDCDAPKMLTCSWCAKSLCFDHFVTNYHRCNTYSD